MIAQRQRLRETAGERRELSEMGDPRVVRQMRQTDLSRCAVVPPAQAMFGKHCRLNGICDKVSDLTDRICWCEWLRV